MRSELRRMDPELDLSRLMTSREVLRISGEHDYRRYAEEPN